MMVVESVAFPKAIAGGPDGTVGDSDVLTLSILMVHFLSDYFTALSYSVILSQPTLFFECKLKKTQVS